ncbi:MAG TPA: ZIP family metal transporter, partial [Bacillota bacterium]
IARLFTAQGRHGRGAARLALSLLAGALIDAVPEAMALGLHLANQAHLGQPLIWAIFLSNLPEALVGAAALRDSGYAARSAVLLWGSILLAVSAFTAAGYLLQRTSDLTEGVLLAIAAGGIVAAVADTLIPTAARFGHHRAGLAAVLGLAMMYALRRAGA